MSDHNSNYRYDEDAKMFRLIPTPIPEGGWNETHIGNEIVLKLPHGTLVEDRIVFLNVFLNVNVGAQQIIGPATELGMLAARMSFVTPLLQQHDRWVMSIDDETEDDSQ